MNLDAVTIAIRPRRPWEAVDLGVLMAKRWWWLLTKVWLTVALPIWFALSFIPQDYILWQVVIFWWLKPVMERPLLYILSHAVFDQAPSYASAVGQILKLVFRKIIITLTWRRLSPSRSMNLPVDQLEGLSGGRRSDRLSVLDREDSGPAFWITLLGFIFEFILAASLLGIAYMLVPRAVDVDLYGLFIEREYTWFNLLQNTMYFCALTLVAPFYVAMGFALYLNRRIKLEAWDIEISFRRIAQRHAKEAARKAQLGGSVSALLFAVLLTFTSFFVSPDLQAQSDSHNSASEHTVMDVSNRDESKALITEVFEGEAFHEIKVEKQADYSHLESEWLKSFFEWLSNLWGDDEDVEPEISGPDLSLFGKLLASGGEILLWLVVIGLVFWIVFHYRHWLLGFQLPEFEREQKKEAPEAMFGMDVRPQSLPADVAEQALQFWQDGQYRTSLALLYRATLVDLFKRGLDVDEGATEQECLKASLKDQQKLNIAEAPMAYFTNLTFHWRRLAYGHIAPSNEEGIALCKDWLAVWRAAPVQQEGGHE